jgi:hypothetical protein
MNSPQDQQENELQELLTSHNSSRNTSKMLLYGIIITCFIITIVIVVVIVSQARKENFAKAEKDLKLKQAESNLMKANIEIGNLRAKLNSVLENKPTYETQDFVNYDVSDGEELEQKRKEQIAKRKHKKKIPPTPPPAIVEKNLPIVKEPDEEEEESFDPEKIIEK